MKVEGSSPSGVPWDAKLFRAGASCRQTGGHPWNNPWTPGTHAFESWKAGYEYWIKIEEKKEQRESN